MERFLLKYYFHESQIAHILKFLVTFVMVRSFQDLLINLVKVPVLAFSLDILMVRKGTKFTI